MRKVDMMNCVWAESGRSMHALLNTLHKEDLAKLHALLFGTKGSLKIKIKLVKDVRAELRACARKPYCSGCS